MTPALHVYDIQEDRLPESIRADEKLLKMFSYTIVRPNEGESVSPEAADYFVVPILFLLDKYNLVGKSAERMLDFAESLSH